MEKSGFHFLCPNAFCSICLAGSVLMNFDDAFLLFDMCWCYGLTWFGFLHILKFQVTHWCMLSCLNLALPRFSCLCLFIDMACISIMLVVWFGWTMFVCCGWTWAIALLFKPCPDPSCCYCYQPCCELIMNTWAAMLLNLNCPVIFFLLLVCWCMSRAHVICQCYAVVMVVRNLFHVDACMKNMNVCCCFEPHEHVQKSTLIHVMFICIECCCLFRLVTWWWMLLLCCWTLLFSS